MRNLGNWLPSCSADKDGEEWVTVLTGRPSELIDTDEYSVISTKPVMTVEVIASLARRAA